MSCHSGSKTISESQSRVHGDRTAGWVVWKVPQGEKHRRESSFQIEDPESKNNLWKSVTMWEFRSKSETSLNNLEVRHKGRKPVGASFGNNINFSSECI